MKIAAFILCLLVGIGATSLWLSSSKCDYRVEDSNTAVNNDAVRQSDIHIQDSDKYIIKLKADEYFAKLKSSDKQNISPEKQLPKTCRGGWRIISKYNQKLKTDERLMYACGDNNKWRFVGYVSLPMHNFD